METLGNTWLWDLLFVLSPIPMIVSMLDRVKLSNLRVLQRFFVVYNQNGPPIPAEWKSLAHVLSSASAQGRALSPKFAKHAEHKGHFHKSNVSELCFLHGKRPSRPNFCFCRAYCCTCSISLKLAEVP